MEEIYYTCEVHKIFWEIYRWSFSKFTNLSSISVCDLFI